jgi:hypothetical protein
MLYNQMNEIASFFADKLMPWVKTEYVSLSCWGRGWQICLVKMKSVLLTRQFDENRIIFVYIVVCHKLLEIEDPIYTPEVLNVF